MLNMKYVCLLQDQKVARFYMKMLRTEKSEVCAPTVKKQFAILEFRAPCFSSINNEIVI